MSAFDKFFEIPELDPAVRKSFRREQLSELTLPLATSLMEGGFVAVVAAKAFKRRGTQHGHRRDGFFEVLRKEC